MPEQHLHRRHIAITRPPGQAKKLAALISEQGGKAVLFPLIDIAPLADYALFEEKLDQLESYDWAIFISTNAVENAMPRLQRRLATLPALRFAAIGPSTAAALKQYGITRVLTPQERFDSESLLALPEMQAVDGCNMMIFRGIGGREVLAETLTKRGAQVDFAECYRRVNPQKDTDFLASLWQNDELDSVVVTSTEAMRHLLDLTDKGKAPWLHGVTLYVNHARIAEAPNAIGLQVAVATAPGDEAMLRCLIEGHAKEQVENNRASNNDLPNE